MTANVDLLSLLKSPVESLAVEYKSWIDIGETPGRATLAKAAIALANHGGGTIVFGGLRIDRGQMQVGSLTAFLAYFTQILMAVLMATMTLVVLPRASVCAERITEVLSTRAAVQDPANPKSPRGGITGKVRLDGATFTYPGADRPVLQDISLTALPGTTTEIVGSTGSGKSTLVSLICRLYDVTAGAGHAGHQIEPAERFPKARPLRLNLE